MLRVFPAPDGAAREIVKLAAPDEKGKTSQRKAPKHKVAAAALARLYPNGRPALTRDEMIAALKAEPGLGNI